MRNRCIIKSLTLDRMGTSFKTPRRAELNFYSALRKVAKVASHIVMVHSDGGLILDHEKLMTALESYSKLIEPWAKSQAAKMIEKVSSANEKAYRKNSKVIGKLMQTNVVARNVGDVAQKLMNEHVALIQSIPIEAGLRAQKIAFAAVTEGSRAVPDQSVIDELKNQFGMTEQVAINRAKLIAVTETARASASLNQARAESVGSRQYIWRNSGDGAVRDSHRIYKGKKLDGMVFSWDNPPTLDDGMTGHPGTFPRCRCFAEPIL